jgi:hypothetical protein
MTLPASGQISLSQVNTELGYASNAQISLNDAVVRLLFQKTTAGSQISMSDGWNKTAYTGTISYTLGAAGAGGVNAANGTAGGNSTLSYSGVSLTANGGGAGQYNNNTAGTGGTATNGNTNATGGTGLGRDGDKGGGGGGGINVSNAVQNANGSAWGGNGASAIDVSGLSAALSGTGFALGTGGTGANNASTPANAKNGGAATGVGAGGGGAGYYGGNGGAGSYGGGGGGAAGYTAANMTGGAGGQGVLVILRNGTTSTVLTSGSSYSIPAGTTSIKVWLIGAGGGGAGSTSTDTTVGGGGGAGGTAVYAWGP